jgi:hypothetical protein
VTSPRSRTCWASAPAGADPGGRGRMLGG